MRKALGLLLLVAACSFDPSGLPAQPPEDAAVDGNTQVDASVADAMIDASIADAPIPDAPPPDALLPPCVTDPLYVPNPTTARRYRYYDTTRNWTEARDDCELDGAHLVVIDDADENEYVRSLGTTTQWIGLNDIDDEDTFVWVTGAPVSYTNWRVDEPNNQNNEDCAEQRDNGDTWNDSRCNESRRFVCECDPDWLP